MNAMNARRIVSAVALVVVVVGIVLFFTRRQETRPVRPRGTPLQVATPLGLPPVTFPADNQPTVEEVNLGRRLYYDPVLSVDNTVSCATCHSPETGFADPDPVSHGIQQKTGTRNSPTVLNSAYFETQFWDGRAPSLEKQAEGPVENAVEMGHTLKGVEQKLNANASYRAEFEKVFGPGPITFEMVEKAIANFERAVVAGNSPFDRWYYGGDQKAVSASVKRGFDVFRDAKKGNCAACHTVGEKYALFTDNQFHNIGVGASEDQFKDNGRFDVTKNPADRGAFKTPSLRNIAQTAPYFHDGSRKDLKQVMDYYIGGANSNPNLDKEVHALGFLSAQERADLLAFLEALTGPVPDSVKPPKTSASN